MNSPMETHSSTPPSLTFCIPFYQGIPYLKETLKSVLNQSASNWLCVVVDDAGPDEGVGQLIEDIGDTRISYVRNKENLGLAGNWNKCVELVQTPYFSILHADDRLCPQYAETMMGAMNRFPHATAIFCRTRIIDQEGSEAFSFADKFKNLLIPSTSQEIILKGEEGLSALMKGNFIFCPTLCYRKARIEDDPFSSKWRMVLDLDWIVRALMSGQELVGVPAVAYEYRRHSENQTAILTKTKLRFVEEVKFHNNTSALCKKRNWTKASTAAKLMLSVRLHLAYQVVACCIRLRIRDAFGYFNIMMRA
jgi:glycosyltransferase involved in cell wall biosynthesis